MDMETHSFDNRGRRMNYFNHSEDNYASDDIASDMEGKDHSDTQIAIKSEHNNSKEDKGSSTPVIIVQKNTVCLPARSHLHASSPYGQMLQMQQPYGGLDAYGMTAYPQSSHFPGMMGPSFGHNMGFGMGQDVGIPMISTYPGASMGFMTHQPLVCETSTEVGVTVADVVASHVEMKQNTSGSNIAHAKGKKSVWRAPAMYGRHHYGKGHKQGEMKHHRMGKCSHHRCTGNHQRYNKGHKGQDYDKEKGHDGSKMIKKSQYKDDIDTKEKFMYITPDGQDSEDYDDVNTANSFDGEKDNDDTFAQIDNDDDYDDHNGDESAMAHDDVPTTTMVMRHNVDQKNDYFHSNALDNDDDEYDDSEYDVPHNGDDDDDDDSDYDYDFDSDQEGEEGEEFESQFNDDDKDIDGEIDTADDEYDYSDYEFADINDDIDDDNEDESNDYDDNSGSDDDIIDSNYDMKHDNENDDNYDDYSNGDDENDTNGDQYDNEDDDEITDYMTSKPISTIETFALDYKPTSSRESKVFQGYNLRASNPKQSEMMQDSHKTSLKPSLKSKRSRSLSSRMHDKKDAHFKSYPDAQTNGQQSKLSDKKGDKKGQKMDKNDKKKTRFSDRPDRRRARAALSGTPVTSSSPINTPKLPSRITKPLNTVKPMGM